MRNEPKHQRTEDAREPEPRTDHAYFLEDEEPVAPIMDADTAINVENVQDESVLFGNKRKVVRREKRDV